MLNGHRSWSANEIALWDTDKPSLLYTDGVGFLIYEWLLIDFDIIFPFRPWLMDALNLLNVPIQVSANGWRIMRAFEVKC